MVYCVENYIIIDIIVLFKGKSISSANKSLNHIKLLAKSMNIIIIT